MGAKKIFYYITKIALLDEIVGILYWAFSLYGLYLIINHISEGFIKIAAIVVYILFVVVVYMMFLKKVSSYFRRIEK